MLGFINQLQQRVYLLYFFLYLTIPTLRIWICNKHSGGVVLEIIKTNALLRKRA